MLTHIWILFVSLIFLCDADIQNRRIQRKPRMNVGNSYEIYTLAQSWPQSSCWDLNKMWLKSGANCSSCPYRDAWTLHGLWPSNRKGGHPSFCNINMKFNQQRGLDPRLRQQLESKWPTYKLHMQNEGFWRYEWEKHGTCALDHESTNSLDKYFTKALELLDKYNVGKIFEKSRIVPGYYYDLFALINAIRSTLKIIPFVQCGKNPNLKEQHVTQVYLCFDKTFQPVNCTDNDNNISDCKRKQKILYPKILRVC